MAKKNKITIEESTSDLPVENLTTYMDIEERQDQLADKVRHLRSLGFDDNRIAAMLMTHKQVIEQIQ